MERKTVYQIFGIDGWKNEDYLNVTEGYLVAKYDQDGTFTVYYNGVSSEQVYYRVKASRLYISAGGLGSFIGADELTRWILFSLLGEKITVSYEAERDLVSLYVKYEA